ncbi:MAG: alpha/beta hydrolase [Pseudomonadota bacterium]|nr:alpha/beta hydrolase [Pseudomonadota bacterium]MEC8668822.1 alpha/beta hydrolase [Pseudomonadota bacterium]
MGILRINMTDASGGIALHGAPDIPLAQALSAHQHGTGPVIVMIHGYRFAPGDARHCPHDHILSLRPDHRCRKALSWPRGLSSDGTGDSFGIAFGWPARGAFRKAYARADQAGLALARLTTLLRGQSPGRRVHVMAHSLGARVALSALHHLPSGGIDRMLLLNGAEYTSRAEAALATPAGRRTEVLHITAHENRAYDLGFELITRAPAPGDRALGLRAPERPNWLTLPIHDAATLAALRRHGFPLAPPQVRICHWSSYLRPGLFPLFRALIGTSQPLPLATLRALLPAETALERPTPWPALRPGLHNA